MKYFITLIAILIATSFANAQKINGQNVSDLTQKTIQVQLVGGFRSKRVIIDYGQRMRGNRSKVVYDDANKRPFTFNSEARVINWFEENGYEMVQKESRLTFGNIKQNWITFRKIKKDGK